MKAVLDIGSNTVRMLLGEHQDGAIYPFRYLRRITRLGGGYDPKSGIASDAAERTMRSLHEFVAVLDEYRPEKVRAVATEAVRRACNSEDFITSVHNQTGLRVEIIDGNEEAVLSSSGVLVALDPRPASALIFDIGGGSTEFIIMQKGAILWTKSYPLGVVALAESVSPLQFIAERLAELQDDLARDGMLELVRAADCELVGTAGTVTTLAAVHLGMVEYDWKRINNTILSGEDLRKLQDCLLPISAAEREAIPGMEPGRGDLICHGLEVVLRLLSLFNKQHLKVSDFGLLEGLLLSV